MAKLYHILSLLILPLTFAHCQSRNKTKPDLGSNKILIDMPCGSFELRINKYHIPRLDTIDFRKLSDSTNMIYYQNATNAAHLSFSLFKIIQSMKEIIATKSGGWADTCQTSLVDDKNLEVSNQYFLKEGHGNQLHDTLIDYKLAMKWLVPETFQASFKIRIDTDDPPTSNDGNHKTWTEYYWEGVSTTAVITELTKFQNDILETELEVVKTNLKLIK